MNVVYLLVHVDKLKLVHLIGNSRDNVGQLLWALKRVKYLIQFAVFFKSLCSTQLKVYRDTHHVLERTSTL